MIIRAKGLNNYNLIRFVVILYPIIDMIYSIFFTIMKVNIPINQVIRVLILIYLISQIRNRKALSVLLLIAGILTVGEFVFIYQGNVALNLIDDMGYITKICLLVTVIFSFESMVKRGIFSTDELIRWLVFSSFLITISIILSLFGLGMDSYNDRSGVKGLFSMQNTATSSLLMIFPLAIYMFYKEKKYIYLICYILILSSLILLGTKAGLFGAVITFIVQMIILAFKTRLTYLKIVISIFILLIAMVFGYMSKGYVSNFIREQQATYFAVGYGDNYYGLIVSNRDLQIEAMKDYTSSLSYNPMLTTGVGFSNSNYVVNARKIEFHSIEQDFYGIYYYSGIWILSIIGIIILRRYLNSIILLFKSKFDYKYFCVFLSLSVGLVHSFFAGHVLYEALSIMYVGSILSVARSECMRFSKDYIEK